MILGKIEGGRDDSIVKKGGVKNKQKKNNKII